LGRPPRTPICPLLHWNVPLFLRPLFCLLLCKSTSHLSSSTLTSSPQIGLFGRDIIGVDSKDSISLLLILNGVGLFGRLIPNYLADRYFGPLNLIIPFTFISGLMLYFWMAVSSHSGLTAFAVVYGLFAAGIQSLFPATITSLTNDLQKAGVRLGMVFSFISFAALTGSPIAGALIQSDHGSFRHAQIFAGSVTLCGCMTLLAARVAKTGWVWKVRT
jgi:predicted MFS family arabinose efflux permease